jgi:hypothetical protein
MPGDLESARFVPSSHCDFHTSEYRHSRDSDIIGTRTLSSKALITLNETRRAENESLRKFLGNADDFQWQTRECIIRKSRDFRGMTTIKDCKRPGNVIKPSF